MIQIYVAIVAVVRIPQSIAWIGQIMHLWDSAQRTFMHMVLKWIADFCHWNVVLNLKERSGMGQKNTSNIHLKACASISSVVRAILQSKIMRDHSKFTRTKVMKDDFIPIFSRPSNATENRISHWAPDSCLRMTSAAGWWIADDELASTHHFHLLYYYTLIFFTKFNRMLPCHRR